MAEDLIHEEDNKVSEEEEILPSICIESRDLGKMKVTQIVL